VLNNEFQFPPFFQKYSRVWREIFSLCPLSSMLSCLEDIQGRRQILNTENFVYKSHRLPAWMLALSLLPFIATVVTGIIGFVVTGALPLGVTFQQITPQIMAAIRTPWVLLNIFVAVAGMNGALAAMLIANTAKKTKARPWMVTVLATNAILVISSIAGMLLRISVVNFNQAVLGENAAYAFSTTLSNVSYPLTFFGIFVLCFGLVVSGMLRKTGLMIGAISVLLFVLSLFPDIRDSMPPFIFGLLWTPLGVGLLMKERQAAVQINVYSPGA
jgi:hypothetical protein